MISPHAIIAVRLWHDVKRWEPGLVTVTESGAWRKHMPCWAVWYAPKPMGGRGLQLANYLPVDELHRYIEPARESDAQADLFDLGGTQQPRLMFSIKRLTARPDIPPFIDSDCWARMRTQLDWWLEVGGVPETMEDHADDCMGRSSWPTKSARDGAESRARRKYGIRLVEATGILTRPMFCDCGYDEQFNRQAGTKFAVACWGEQLLQQVHALKPGWGHALLTDPRKVRYHNARRERLIG